MADQAPNIYPFMRIADANAALEWLSRAFGSESSTVGAEIAREIEDTEYGSRGYTARDPEGHVRSFGTYRPTIGR